MDNKLMTFADIFSVSAENGNRPIVKITIPKIQRDYVQGRTGRETERIRLNFLKALHDAITGKPIVLDFVYGNVDDDGCLTPLDGQQRLTTLFLLHWYAAKKEAIGESEWAFLSRFSYETRYSSRDFCSMLVEYVPDFSLRLSSQIIDQPWFPLSWKNDPTISSMLTMVDAIDDEFKKQADIWPKLKEGAISFYFLPLQGFGLTEDLYVKMNSRGKLLTRFENFKAELEHCLRERNEKLADNVAEKIDGCWTDVFWPYRDKTDNTIDDGFLRYFFFVSDIIYYKDGKSLQGKLYDEIDRLDELFASSDDNGGSKAESSIRTLASMIECWSGINDAKMMFDGIFSVPNDYGNVLKIWSELFGNCLSSYADLKQGTRSFSLAEFTMLYAICLYMCNRSDIGKDLFIRRLRIVNNLVRNSADELSDSENRTGGNRMPIILRQVESIMLNGDFDSSFDDAGFSRIQIKEEKDKFRWLKVNPEQYESLARLEDNNLLYGRVAIVGLDDAQLFPRFNRLFECDWDKVDRALMSMGEYQQKENWYRCAFGSSKLGSAWRGLFHGDPESGDFQKIKRFVRDLLCCNDGVLNNDFLDEIADSFILSREKNALFDFSYYYVKYDVFRPGSYGKMCRTGESQYDYYVMMTPKNFVQKSAYCPYLMAADRAHYCPSGSLVYEEAGIQIWCHGAGYVVEVENEKGEWSESPDLHIHLDQSSDGIDLQDRIVVLEEWLAEHQKLLGCTSDDGSANF